MSQVYRDHSGHFISRAVYIRNTERRLRAGKQYRVDGKFVKKQSRSWLFWLAVGAVGIAVLSWFI